LAADGVGAGAGTASVEVAVRDCGVAWGCGSPMLRRGRPLVSDTSIGLPPIALMSDGNWVEA
jgi:hypothetical protein